jgi:hypothetical protein
VCCRYAQLVVAVAREERLVVAVARAREEVEGMKN